ncbi:putative membrane protein insertion efficiency factor [compost metagenome]
MKKNHIKKMVIYIIHIPRNLEIILIEFYQKHISNGLGHRCIYHPTCSEYTKQAVDKYGIIKGNILGIYRILRCNPFSKGGIDYLK